MPPHGKGPLRIAIEDFLESFGFGRRFLKGLKASLEEVVPEVDQDITAIFEKIIAGDPDAVNEMLEYVRSSPDSVFEKIFVSVATVWSAVSLIMPGAMTPMVKNLLYGADFLARSWRPDPILLQQLYWRNPEMGDQLEKLRGDLGMSPRLAEWQGNTLRPRAPEGTLLAALFRGILSAEDISAELGKRGYTSEDITTILETAPIIPGVNDLIRFAVREAFSPDIIARFGYDKDFPEEILQFTRKIGLTDDWVKRYWYSHWELPSATLGFEMLHRLRPDVSENPFSVDDLETLLRAADVPEFYRKRLIEVSYSPYTRVDVRRMYQAGVLNQEDVLRSYLDLGYNDERAQKLTEWTVRESHAAEKDLTRAAIQKAYKQRRYSSDNALTALQAIGYSADEAQFWLDDIDFALAEELEAESIDRAELLYTEGQITSSQIFDILGPLNLPAEQIALLIERWDIKLFKRITFPSRSELDEFYKRGVIAVEAYREGLRSRRYQPETITSFELSLDWEIQQDAAKEAERAQKELERVLLAEQATAYARERAALDVEIAELRVQLAEIKLALHGVTDTGQQAELKETSDAIRVDIQTIQLAKAQLRREAI